MNALIIFAHPEPRSLNGRLKDQSLATLRDEGHSVLLSDLYAIKFNPVAGPDDFTRRADPDYFDLQKEQRYALEHGLFTADIATEQEKLRWADLVLFHFPFWWYSMPAIVKGYFDRVFSVGFAYGGGTALAGKKAIVCTTTGSGTDWLNERQPPGSLNQIFHHILYGTFAFSGMITLEPFGVYHAKRLSEEQKINKLEEWTEVLKVIDQRRALFVP